jgi:hypothetical protein
MPITVEIENKVNTYFCKLWQYISKIQRLGKKKSRLEKELD